MSTLAPKAGQSQREYVTAFWNKASAVAPTDESSLKPVGEDAGKTPLEQYFWKLIGDVRGLDILEVGCGLGDDTLRYARRGARVTSIDISDVAVERVRARLSAANVEADVRVMDAFDVRSFDKKFDLIVGKLILHHLEPFAEISEIFADRLKPEGRMVFAENNSRNPWLIFARNHLAGKYGIPKHGDNVEHPLTPEEVRTLGMHFDKVECHFPWLVFFRKLNTYIFRGKPVFRPMMWVNNKVDDTLWRVAPAIRPLSYLQIVVATKPIGSGAVVSALPDLSAMADKAVVSDAGGVAVLPN